jgi:hypothetical protein
MILPLDLLKFHHIVPRHSLFFIHFLLDVPHKKDPIEGKVLQFLLPQWEPANTFSIGTHEKHCGQLTKY